jgi:SET domain-containing protein
MDSNCFQIRASNIHGLGLFPLVDIKSLTKITDYLGEEMTWQEFKLRYGNYKENSLNTYPMRRIWKILVAKEEPYKSLNIVNFINEGNPPNCVLKKRALYALRDIQPNEELLLQYPKDYNRYWIK